MLSQDISCGLHLPGGKNEKEYFPGDAELYTTDWVEGGGGMLFFTRLSFLVTIGLYWFNHIKTST